MKAFLALALFVPSLVLGQEPALKSLRLIPLGEGAEWAEKLEGEKRIQIIKDGQMPSPEVSMANGRKDGKHTADLFLRRMTPTMRFSPKVEHLQLYAGKELNGPPMVKAPFPRYQSSLGLLYTGRGEGKNWKEPKILLLDDGEKAFPLGQMRFANVSDQVALVKAGKKLLVINPGEAKQLSLKPGNNEVMIGYQVKGTKSQVVLHKAWQVRIMANQRVQAFFFNKNSKKREKLVGFISMPEPKPKL